MDDGTIVKSAGECLKLATKLAAVELITAKAGTCQFYPTGVPLGVDGYSFYDNKITVDGGCQASFKVSYQKYTVEEVTCQSTVGSKEECKVDSDIISAIPKTILSGVCSADAKEKKHNHGHKKKKGDDYYAKEVSEDGYNFYKDKLRVFGGCGAVFEVKKELQKEDIDFFEPVESMSAALYGLHVENSRNIVVKNLRIDGTVQLDHDVNHDGTGHNDNILIKDNYINPIMSLIRKCAWGRNISVYSLQNS